MISLKPRAMNRGVAAATVDARPGLGKQSLGVFQDQLDVGFAHRRADLPVNNQAAGAILGRAGHRTVLVAVATRRLGEGSSTATRHLTSS